MGVVSKSSEERQFASDGRVPLAASTAPNLMAMLSQQNVTIMIDLIEAADLADYVAMQGPMTLIAPTDEAFRNQPAGYIDDLKADKARIKHYVRYHLIHGDIFSWDISRSTNIRAQNGHILRFYYRSKHFGEVPSLRVNTANVVKHDIQANNGVIQLVDDILNVPEGTVEEVLVRDSNLTTIANITFISHLNSLLNKTRAGRRQTVFAPSDDAFARMDQSVLQKIIQHSNLARELMSFHIHPGTLTIDQMKSSHSRRSPPEPSNQNYSPQYRMRQWNGSHH
ncbi:Hypothetical predicted protein [Octopus vulgaris]|uniref:FAS1 domain-containing protein n=1 Tax=Octopus vulgaris TaxID=6645 RepID=A0AA36BF38_OCTVU|nr:Hypothetical predicted protein [Octopus vulgaris]